MLLAHAKVALVTRDTAGYNAIRVSMDLPIAQAVVKAVAQRAKVRRYTS